ncbi:MAG: hypothetical protein DHS20C11_24770 [Lysobacteraceae bacterium]|nr:MAG: hypothetical protein DHS20C11_24770 [Xanthomonadaceae bacterium]
MNDPMATHGAPSWIEHNSGAPDQAREFYADVLGWTIADLPMKDGSAYPGVMLGETPVGGISPIPVEQGAWRIYITVDDVDARHAKALAAGAQCAGEPMSVPGVGRMASVTDPFGATIAFITYEAPTE